MATTGNQVKQLIKLAEEKSMSVLFIDEVNEKFIKIKTTEFKKLIKE